MNVIPESHRANWSDICVFILKTLKKKTRVTYKKKNGTRGNLAAITEDKGRLSGRVSALTSIYCIRSVDRWVKDREYRRDNPWKLATEGTQDENKNKTKTQYTMCWTPQCTNKHK